MNTATIITFRYGKVLAVKNEDQKLSLPFGTSPEAPLCVARNAFMKVSHTHTQIFGLAASDGADVKRSAWLAKSFESQVDEPSGTVWVSPSYLTSAFSAIDVPFRKHR